MGQQPAQAVLVKNLLSTSPQVTVKEKFYELLQNNMARIPASEVVLLLGDWNRHVSAEYDCFSDVQGGYRD